MEERTNETSEKVRALIAQRPHGRREAFRRANALKRLTTGAARWFWEDTARKLARRRDA